MWFDKGATIWSHTEKCQFLWKVLHFLSYILFERSSHSSPQWTAYTTLLSLCKGVLSLGWTIIFYGCWCAWSALECYSCREIFQHCCHILYEVTIFHLFCWDRLSEVLLQVSNDSRDFFFFFKWRRLSDERQNVFKHFNPFFCTNFCLHIYVFPFTAMIWIL